MKVNTLIKVFLVVVTSGRNVLAIVLPGLRIRGHDLRAALDFRLILVGV
jgi:hypothetical protein